VRVVARLAAVHQRPCNTQHHARMQAPAMKCSAMVAVTCVPLQSMASGAEGGGAGTFKEQKEARGPGVE
jgi:hypothetical protein